MRKPKLRMLASAGALSLALAGGVGIATASSAQASMGIDMNLACQYTNHLTSYKGVLMYPNQGGLGWRCVDRAIPPRPTTGVDLWGYCVNVWGYSGAYNNTPSNPYTWYCG